MTKATDDQLPPLPGLYGFPATATSALYFYEAASRGTGRSSRLIERVTNADIIITTQKTRRHYEQALRDALKTTRVIVCDPSESLPRRQGGRDRVGKMYLSHDWIFERYLDDLRRVNRQLQHDLLEAGVIGNPEPNLGLDDAVIRGYW